MAFEWTDFGMGGFYISFRARGACRFPSIPQIPFKPNIYHQIPLKFKIPPQIPIQTAPQSTR